jgi:hypothetical protein
VAVAATSSRVARGIGHALLTAALVSCGTLAEPPPLAKTTGALTLGQWVPRLSERDAIGPVQTAVGRRTPAFRSLTQSQDPLILFKDEESTGADRVMTPRLSQRLSRLNRLVQAEWDGVRVRVTEAWDEDREHGPQSAHYAGRAVDLTTSDLDGDKLGRLAFLAVQAGFDWVYFEDRTHVHASVRK